jgi:hypothetical protein
MTNADVARQLDRVAELLELQAANPFRVHAYRHAADALRELDEPVEALLSREGPGGLKAFGIGQAIASVLEELVSTGRLRMLERLERELPPLVRLQQVPGFGPKLAKQVHDALHVETLEELEVAAHDGSLERLPGFGPRRTQLVRDALAGMLKRTGRPSRAAQRPGPPRAPPPHLPALHPERPPVSVLLDVDAEYRKKAEAGRLPTIAPSRSCTSSPGRPCRPSSSRRTSGRRSPPSSPRRTAGCSSSTTDSGWSRRTCPRSRCSPAPPASSGRETGCSRSAASRSSR